MSNVCFIPNLGAKRTTDEPKWGADFFADAFTEHSIHEITTEYSLDNMNDYDVIWVHNVANLLKGVRGRLELLPRLWGKHPPIIGGVRGEVGFDAARQYLRLFQAIHTSNVFLSSQVHKYNRNVYTLSSGVDLDLFAPSPPPEGFTLGWAGDKNKNMKNVDIVHALLVPTRYATKENYIPNHEMPARFYHRINALVHPSRHEGSCRVITEAAACGLPIICTDVGHNSSIVHPDFLITLDDPVPQIKALIKMLKEYPLYAQSVGLENRGRVRQYAWSRVIGRADKIIEAVKT